MGKKVYKTHYLAKASIANISESEVSLKDLPAKTDASQEPVSIDRDLMKVISVLFSIGMNKNDDCFIKDEVLPARNTGAHKPVDIEHDSSKIVGHILRSYVTTKGGDIIEDDLIEKDPTSCPDDFDVTNEAVIYKYLLPDTAEKIKQSATEGKLFVSVEAWFTDYDYLVGNKIVKRNKKTSSVLDEVLRINGGTGIYKGQKVGRVLRQLLIGGVGLVEKPANPDSVIKSVSYTQDLDPSTLDAVVASNIIGSLPVQKAEESIIEPIIASSTAVGMTITNSPTQPNQVISIDFEESQVVKDLRATIANLNEDIKVKDGTIWALEIDMDQVAKELKVFQDKEKERIMLKKVEERTLVLKNKFSFTNAFIVNEMMTCAAMSDEEFNKYIERMEEIINGITVADEQKKEGGETPVTPPSPAPETSPAPEVAPAPVSTPAPEPAPNPQPAPTTAPTPEPVAPTVPPAVPPAPTPVPVPVPAPAPSAPAPVSTPAPVSEPVVPQEPLSPPQEQEQEEEEADDDGDVSIDSATPVDLDITPEVDDKKGSSLLDQFRNIFDKFMLDKKGKLRI